MDAPYDGAEDPDDRERLVDACVRPAGPALLRVRSSSVLLPGDRYPSIPPYADARQQRGSPLAGSFDICGGDLGPCRCCDTGRTIEVEGQVERTSAMTGKRVIHVGVDGSWRESGALEWALQQAELRHEPLRALHVTDEAVRGTPYWWSPPPPGHVDAARLGHPRRPSPRALPRRRSTRAS
jgi:hypothetical protein